MHSARPSRAVKVLIERGRFRVSHKIYAIESQTTTQRGFSRAHSVSKSIAKTARTRGRLFCFTFEAFFYKFARLVSRTSANVVTKIEYGFFCNRNKRLIFFCEPNTKAPKKPKKSVTLFFGSTQIATYLCAQISTYCNMSRYKKRTRTPGGGGESDDDISVLDPALNSERNSGRSSRKSSRANSLATAPQIASRSSSRIRGLQRC